MNGILSIDKPQGMTSHDVVARARRLLREKRIGHAGTLDPMATGVLVLCVGHATRLSEYLLGEDKAYEGAIKLGERTNTDDAEGEVIAIATRARYFRATCCAHSNANLAVRLSRCRRNFRPFTQTANGHMLWRARARRWSWMREGDGA